MQQQTSIALVMIVKDEAETVLECIEAARPIISAWAVIDTGSTDGTQKIIEEALGDLPGRLEQSDWGGFGPARTAALELGRTLGVDYLLMLDADHRLHIEGELPELEADSYRIRVRGPMAWKLPLLTRASYPFSYRGVAHSYLSSAEAPDERDLPQLSIDGGPGASREKIEADLQLFLTDIAENPSTRSVFYLAQTYCDLDMRAEAIEWYRKRVTMGGWDEEVFWAFYRWGLILSWSDFDAAIPVLLKAWEYRPTRCEPIWVLARGFHQIGMPEVGRYFTRLGLSIPLPDDSLFVMTWMYDPEKWLFEQPQQATA